MNKHEIINATRHPINIINGKGVLVRIFNKSNIQIRLDEQIKMLEDISGIPVGSVEWKEARGLPEETPDKFYIVSQLTQHALQTRKDLLVPKDIVRDISGNILGCRMLTRLV